MAHETSVKRAAFHVDTSVGDKRSISVSNHAPVVLAVVDDPDIQNLAREASRSAGWTLVEHDRATDAMSACMSSPPAAILVQACLPGADVFVAAKERGTSTAPVVAIGNVEEIELLLAAGAADGITLPTTSALLAHRVRTAMRLVRAEGESARSSRHGDLVADGSATRENFLRRVEAALHAPGSHRGSVVVLHLSFIPDPTLSGEGLDVAVYLQAAEERLCDQLRNRDSVGASSTAAVSTSEGRELLVLLESLERPQEAYKIARRLREQLGAPLEIGGRTARVDVSVGIGVHPNDGETAADLCQAARLAASAARQDSTHAIRYATQSMDASAFERLTLESNLRHALARRELVLYYQPRVEIATGRVVSFEALLRWKHPELGMVSPAQFIPIAEESGLIVPIGEWVMHQACAQNRRWRDAGLPHVRMAVNLSSVQFRRPDIETTIARALEDNGLPADGLELELTESMLLQDGERTADTLRAIREMGVHLSIDDFGTGYSSLSYIKRFPVDALKIDQSFIREVTSSPEDAAITTSIILMSRTLDLSVVAEGVETKSQLEFLRVLECDEAQGYLFSRPVPAEDAVVFLATGFPTCAAA